MLPLQTGLRLDGAEIVRLESEHLRVDVAPEIGGRIVSLIEKERGHEFLWRNASLRLERQAAGTEYDPNFYGGIDELLPNDIPETLHNLACPDHGELWTTPLEWSAHGGELRMRGALPRFGLLYERALSLAADPSVLECTYRITNQTSEVRQFLWKLHAALQVGPGDIVDCPARLAQVVDPAWSRFKTLAPFPWPNLEGQAANVVRPAEGTVDFFYLFDLQAGVLRLQRPAEDLCFSYEFDRRTFPYAWVFASYGGFNGHYTVVLEPCSSMPLSVREAAALGQCTVLGPRQHLTTTVRIRAGRQTDAPSSESQLRP
jgi:hypothetical protein